MRHLVKFKHRWVVANQAEYHLVLGHTQKFIDQMNSKRIGLFWSHPGYEPLRTKPPIDIHSTLEFHGVKYSPLMVAIHSDVRGSHVPLVKHLLSHQVDINHVCRYFFSQQEWISQTALSSAVVLNNKEMLMTLCQAKPDLSIRFTRPLSGQIYEMNVFHYALRMKRLNLFQMLLDYDCPNKLEALNALDSWGCSVKELFYANVSNEPKFDILKEKFEVYMGLEPSQMPQYPMPRFNF